MTDVACFLIPKAFLGVDAVHQDNTLAFLRDLEIEVMLLGDDPGCAEAARRFEARHLPDLPRNAHGTPLVNAAFALAAAHSKASHLCYLNADILFSKEDFLSAVPSTLEAHPRALLTGSRVDLDLPEPLRPEPGVWQALVQRAARTGVRRYPAAMDYFVFPRDAFQDMPAFAVGRPGWDNWMVSAALKEGRPVIDLSEDLLVIHQNHTYHHVDGTLEGYRNGPESQSNRQLAGGYLRLYNLRDATHQLVGGRISKRWGLSVYPAYRVLMHATARVPFLRALFRACLHPIRFLRGSA